jgi:hypothetical protein
MHLFPLPVPLPLPLPLIRAALWISSASLNFSRLYDPVGQVTHSAFAIFWPALHVVVLLRPRSESCSFDPPLALPKRATSLNLLSLLVLLVLVLLLVLLSLLLRKAAPFLSPIRITSSPLNLLLLPPRINTHNHSTDHIPSGLHSRGVRITRLRFILFYTCHIVIYRP